MNTPRLDKAMNAFRSNLPASRDELNALGTVKAKWLLVSCIDCRYPHVVHEWMRNNYPKELYDQLVLAGACLSVSDSYTRKTGWRETFLEHVDLSIELHSIDGVLLLDHRTCGAYREFHLLTKEEENTSVELERHREVAEEVVTLVRRRFQFKSRQGFIQALLAPEVVDPAACDFPTDPEWLAESRA